MLFCTLHEILINYFGNKIYTIREKKTNIKIHNYILEQRYVLAKDYPDERTKLVKECLKFITGLFFILNDRPSRYNTVSVVCDSHPECSANIYMNILNTR